MNTNSTPSGFAPKPETEADREAKRRANAAALIPPGSCLPAILKDPAAVRLDLAAVKGDAVLCATDIDKSRLLGTVACWKVDLKDKTLQATDAAPMPGRGFDVMLDDRCARGFCLPADARIPNDHLARIAWSMDGKKAAVLAGDDVHIFDTETKVHEVNFSIRGDKGVPTDPTGIHFIDDTIFVEAADSISSGVWVFKADGTQVGAITPLGAKETDKPVSTRNGSFSLLDHSRVAIGEQGFTQMTIYDIESGKRTKATRRPPHTPCKSTEVDSFWKDGEKVSDKCREAMNKEFAPFIGATAIAGKTNLLVALRGDRVGELAVVDPKTLTEDTHKLIKLPWCDDAAAQPAAGSAAAAPAAGSASVAAPDSRQ